MGADNYFGRSHFLSWLCCKRSFTALSHQLLGPRSHCKRCVAEGFSFSSTGNAKAGHLQEQRWIHDPWPALCSQKSDRQRSGADLYSWRPSAPDAARLPLHVLLLQRLRRESVSSQFGVHGSVGELPAWHHVWS